jgi:hypothetical protein
MRRNTGHQNALTDDVKDRRPINFTGQVTETETGFVAQLSVLRVDVQATLQGPAIRVDSGTERGTISPESRFGMGWPQPKQNKIPSGVCSLFPEKKDLVMNLVIQGHCYEFVLDSGAQISLAQSHVSNGPVGKSQHMVRHIISELLETKGPKGLEFYIGN